ncbi:hypothetical protein EF903_17900 [Streptomyces sp. WAC05292]|uniref:hypothetical protein n=1 Tax=Streptomyces sp. WAC05292 TaxID=2487418 RepID=UPI000F736EC0|nr:hypothetical protein [Streptomyces sp. WAC05292]RSS87041.1 hypothetical protein EF903_17900 [Streptomyces sp. WAC05292]
MGDFRPVANGLRTDHPVPGLPFINDERLPLDNPDAIERTGRDQGEGLWGRTDPLPGDGWVAFTTEPKNRAYAWAVHYHPEHGRTVVLVTDASWSGLHHDWVYSHTGFLYRHGGYWWDGTAWHRPGVVFDGAYERYDARPVRDALTVTAADLLVHPADPGKATVATIAGFTAHKTALPNWRDHLALWAEHRRRVPDARPLDECVVDLKAPELEPGLLVDRAGLAKIANIPEDDLPDPKYEDHKMPEPQAHGAAGPLWSQPVARDWAEQHHRAQGPGALLSATTSFGTPQPQGLVADHNRLTKVIQGDGKQTEEAAKTLAWWPAVSLTVGPESLVPMSALRTTLIEAVLSHLATGVRKGRTGIWLGTLRRDVVEIFDWYVQRKPDHTAHLLSEICLDAHTRLNVDPETVGKIIRRSLHLDSKLGEKTIDALLDMALPPSAKPSES